ncbi:hypothetical protein WA158_006050 [Blastocystis sp. Blastoise]
MSSTNERYDRQIRLWGLHGQLLIEKTCVCVVGSDSVASEIIKNLVLVGIHSIYIIDDLLVTQKDIENNFFISADSIGKERATIIAENLQKLNSNSHITVIKQNIHEFLTHYSKSNSSYDFIVINKLFPSSSDSNILDSFEKDNYIYTYSIGLWGSISCHILGIYILYNIKEAR